MVIYFIILSIIAVVYLFTMLTIVTYKRDPSIGNFTWGGGCILISLYTFFVFSNFYSRQILVTALIFLWGARLTFYVYLRYKKGADPRFVEWINKKGAYAMLFNFFWIIILQGIMMIIMSLPAIFTNLYSGPGLNLLDFLGIGLWLIGFYFESTGDYQLYTFLKIPENKGKIMDQGLWRYTRHPNYFGEILMWWAIYLIALSVPFGWITIIAPLTITILLLFFTGIPMNEKVFENNPEYQEYKQRTNTLIPWWPKK